MLLTRGCSTPEEIAIFVPMELMWGEIKEQ